MKKEKYTYLSCNFHKAQSLISNLPSHLYQQAEYQRPGSQYLGMVWLRRPPTLAGRQACQSKCFLNLGSDIKTGMSNEIIERKLLSKTRCLTVIFEYNL
jgi:hypothetical protein